MHLVSELDKSTYVLLAAGSLDFKAVLRVGGGMETVRLDVVILLQQVDEPYNVLFGIERLISWPRTLNLHLDQVLKIDFLNVLNIHAAHLR